jgi:hypothetical protein
MVVFRLGRHGEVTRNLTFVVANEISREVRATEPYQEPEVVEINYEVIPGEKPASE